MSSRLTLLLLLAISGLITSCFGPGHRLAFEQFGENHAGPVIAVQGYVIDGDGESLRADWLRLAEAMRTKKGFLTATLSPGIGRKSNLWLAEARWEGLADLRAAFADPAIQVLEAALPKQRFAHLFSPDCTVEDKRVACPNAGTASGS
jgi:hypothetical protein